MSLHPGHRAVLFAGLASLSMGNAVLMAVLGPVARQIGISDARVGLVHSLAAAVVILAAPFWGRQADRAGPRGVFALGVLGGAAAGAAMAGAMAAGAAGLWASAPVFAALLAARLVYAALASAALPAAAGLLAARSAPEVRARAMALPSAAFSVGSVLGGAVVLPAVAVLGPTGPVLLVALLGTVVAALALGLPGGGAAAPAPVTAPRRAGPWTVRLGLVMATAALAVTATSLHQATVPFYLQDRLGLTTEATIRQAALLGLGLTLATLAGLALSARLTLRPESRVLAGAMLAGLGMALMIGGPGLGRLGLSHGLIGFGFGLFVPALQALVSLSVAPDRQAEAAGLLSAATTAGYVLGPSLGIALYGQSADLAYQAATALFLPLGALVLLTRRTGPSSP